MPRQTPRGKNPWRHLVRKLWEKLKPRGVKRLFAQRVNSPCRLRVFLVGFSWLPLFKEGRLSSQEFSIPVSCNLPPGYLAIKEASNTKVRSGRRVSDIWVFLESSLALFYHLTEWSRCEMGGWRKSYLQSVNKYRLHSLHSGNAEVDFATGWVTEHVMCKEPLEILQQWNSVWNLRGAK